MHNAYRLVAALLAGTLFGFGLSVAQMIDPAKVVNFLNIFGTWDPSLAFVMAGGLIVNAIATPLILGRRTPVFADYFQLPTKTEVDRRLIIGGVIFGVGWGITGYCPGPMLTSLSFVDTSILTVVVSYIAGTFIIKWGLNQMRGGERAGKGGSVTG